MKSLQLIVALFFIFTQKEFFGQTAFYNKGDMVLHSNASVSFHTDVINDGYLNNDNGGKAVFYSDGEPRVLKGEQRPVFYNVDIASAGNLKLEVAMAVTSELYFLDGKVITPRDKINVSLDFINYKHHAGENNNRHVDGYASVTGIKEFSFPIGDNDRLRTMVLPTQNTNTNLYRGAYFFQDPNNPTTFSESFSTQSKETSIEKVSTMEFWDLNGNKATSITLTWDEQSNIAFLTSNISSLRVVGWHKNNKKWKNLGNLSADGNIERGKIKSKPFLPDEYEALTIGSVDRGEKITGNNYLISPNGDAKNETLYIDEVEDVCKNNSIMIYNRWGTRIYKKENYKNDWKGISKGRFTFDKGKKLPVGAYFYILKCKNLSNNNETIKKGWVYVNR